MNFALPNHDIPVATESQPDTAAHPAPQPHPVSQPHPASGPHPALMRALASMLCKVPQLRQQLTGVITAGQHGIVLDVAGLALAATSAALQPSERAMCFIASQLLAAADPTETTPLDAHSAGPSPTRLPTTGRSFGQAWADLPASWQVLVADALSLASHEQLVEHTAALQAQGMAVPAPLPSGGFAMRVKVGPAQLATADDGLGRREVGYREGLSAQELWDRGRGLWKLNADKAMQSDVLLIAHSGVTVMVGAITGLQRIGNRLAVTGYPLPHHPLVNRPDPLHNTSRNPVTYGTIPS